MKRPVHSDLARARILDAANGFRHKVYSGNAVPLTMRHLQKAVCIVRRRSLVEDHVLTEAGFNPKGG